MSVRVYLRLKYINIVKCLPKPKENDVLRILNLDFKF